MGLLKNILFTSEKFLLTEVDIRDIVINKLSLTEKEYATLTKEIDKKFIIIVANIFKNRLIQLKNDPDTFRQAQAVTFRDAIFDGIVNNFKQFREEILTQDNRPKFDLKKLTNADIAGFIANAPTIFDYRDAVTPTPNLRLLEWDEALQIANEWHGELERGEANTFSKQILEVAPDAEVIHTFDDGYKWVDMNTSRCSELGSLMSHCATTNKGDTLLNLVTKKGEFVVTVAFSYDGTYYQMKGTANTKPTKYEKWILWLFTNNGKYQLKEKGKEHDPSRDFTINDITDINLKEKIIKEYPALIKQTISSIIERFNSKKIDKDTAISQLNGLIGNSRWGYDSLSIVNIIDGNTFDVQYHSEDLTRFLFRVFEIVPTRTKRSSTAIDKWLISQDNYDFAELIDDMKFRVNSIFTEELKKRIINNAKENYGQTILKAIDWETYSDDKIIDYVFEQFNINGYDFSSNTITDGESVANSINSKKKQRFLDLMWDVLNRLNLYKQDNIVLYRVNWYDYNDEDSEEYYGDFTLENIYNEIYDYTSDFAKSDEIKYLDDKEGFNKFKQIVKKLQTTKENSLVNDSTSLFIQAIIYFVMDEAEMEMDEHLLKPLLLKKLLSKADIEEMTKIKDPNQLSLKFENKHILNKFSNLYKKVKQITK